MAFTNAGGRTQSSLADINITPLVDVVLVLLVIFMLTANLIVRQVIEVQLPQLELAFEFGNLDLSASVLQLPDHVAPFYVAARRQHPDPAAR